MPDVSDATGILMVGPPTSNKPALHALSALRNAVTMCCLGGLSHFHVVLVTMPMAGQTVCRHAFCGFLGIGNNRVNRCSKAFQGQDMRWTGRARRDSNLNKPLLLV
jgi:hypothetical protein